MKIYIAGSIAIAICGPAAFAEPACSGANITEPKDFIVHDPRPKISWQPVQGASSYVLWGESRVPEGRMIFTNEIRTSETVWIPPVPLAEETTTVKIRVTALCQDAPSNSPVLVPTANRPTTRFRIESPLNCRIDEEPVSDYHGDTLHLKWTAAPAANEYEVSIRSAIDAKQFTTQSSSFPEAHIRDVPQGVWILSVQARCGKTLGPRRYASIAIR